MKGEGWRDTFQFENSYFTEEISGSEAGSYFRLIGFVYHSTLGLRVIKKGGKDSRADPGMSQSPCPSS